MTSVVPSAAKGRAEKRLPNLPFAGGPHHALRFVEPEATVVPRKVAKVDELLTRCRRLCKSSRAQSAAANAGMRMEP